MKPNEVLQQIMQINSDQYNQIVFDHAIEYLQTILDGDDWAFDHLVKTKVFWEWWKRQWDCREFAFVQSHQLNHIAPCDYADVKSIIIDLWNELHNTGSLNIKPNNIVMEASFAEMIAEVIGGDERNKKGVGNG